MIDHRLVKLQRQRTAGADADNLIVAIRRRERRRRAAEVGRVARETGRLAEGCLRIVDRIAGDEVVADAGSLNVTDNVIGPWVSGRRRAVVAP
jgi:hypothetical protein